MRIRRLCLPISRHNKPTSNKPKPCMGDTYKQLVTSILQLYLGSRHQRQARRDLQSASELPPPLPHMQPISRFREHLVRHDRTGTAFASLLAYRFLRRLNSMFHAPTVFHVEHLRPVRERSGNCTCLLDHEKEVPGPSHCGEPPAKCCPAWTCVCLSIGQRESHPGFAAHGMRPRVTASLVPRGTPPLLLSCGPWPIALRVVPRETPSSPLIPLSRPVGFGHHPAPRDAATA